MDVVTARRMIYEPPDVSAPFEKRNCKDTAITASLALTKTGREDVFEVEEEAKGTAATTGLCGGEEGPDNEKVIDLRFDFLAVEERPDDMTARRQDRGWRVNPSLDHDQVDISE